MPDANGTRRLERDEAPTRAERRAWARRPHPDLDPVELAATVDAFERYELRRGLRLSTVEARMRIVRRWWTAVGDPWQATRRDVEAFMDTAQVVPSTRYYIVSHLHRFYRWARREGLCRRDPTELVDRPRLRPRLPRPIGDVDLALAITVAPTPQLRTALVLAAGCGLRAVELANLRWDDIGTDWLRLDGKGGRERVVPLHPAARLELDRLDRPDEWVLPWRIDEVGCGRRVSQVVNQHLRRIGVKASLHQLRHAFATAALSSSGDLRAVQELLGHASPATTAIYTKLDPSRLAPIVEAIIIPGTVIEPSSPAADDTLGGGGVATGCRRTSSTLTL